MGKNIVINEFEFTRLVELGRVAVHNAEIPRSIVEKTLVRIAVENNISIKFIIGL